MASGQRRAPADELGGSPERLLPLAVRRCVNGDEGLALARDVAQAQLEAIDAECPRARVEVRLHGPVDLWIAEAAEGRGGGGVREDRAGHDPRRGHAVGAATGIAALAHDAIGDVGVGPQQVIRGDVLEDELAVGLEAGPHAHLGRGSTHGLEGFFEGQHQAHRPAGAEGHEGHQRFELGVLLAAEPAARVGRVDAHLGERQMEDPGHRLLEPVGMLDRAPQRDAVPVRGGHERMGLDREVGHHGEGVGVVDDHLGGGRLDVAPPVAMLGQDVAEREGIAGTQLGLLHERRRGIERGGEGDHRGQRLVLHADQAGRLLGGVERVGGDGRDRLAVVLRLAHREDRSILELGPEARHRLGQVGRGHDQTHPGHARRGSRIDAHDAPPRAVERHQLGVEHVRQADVRHVLLQPRDPLLPPDARRGGADLLVHRSSTPAVTRTASVIIG